MFCTGCFRGAPGSRWRDFRCGYIEGSIPKPPSADSLPARGHFRPQQLVAGVCVLLERRLIGAVRRALGGDHARGGTASYSFGSDESGIAIMARHDLSPVAG